MLAASVGIYIHLASVLRAYAANAEVPVQQGVTVLATSTNLKVVMARFRLFPFLYACVRDLAIKGPEVRLRSESTTVQAVFPQAFASSSCCLTVLSTFSCTITVTPASTPFPA